MTDLLVKNDIKQNISLLRPEILKVYPESIIMADLCLAQAILESRLLGVPSGLARDCNNLFGIKGKGTLGTVYLLTHEYVRGKEITVKAGFAKNLTLEDSIKQHRHVLELPRYKKVWTSQTFNEAADAIRLAGYATDINYTRSLIDIYNKYIKILDNPA